MTKKISYSLIVALSVISLLFFAPKGVFADTVYSQPVQTSFTSLSGCSFTNIGSFVASATYNLTSSSTFRFYGKKSDSNEISLYLSSTNNTGGFLHNALFYFNSSVGAWADAQYTGSDTLTSGNTYWFFAFSCNGSVGDFGTNGSNPTGYIYTAAIPPDDPTETTIISISPQDTDPYTDTATTSVTYSITPEDLAAGEATLNYVINSMDFIYQQGISPQIAGSIIATTSGFFTETFTVPLSGFWIAQYTLTGVAGQEPNIGASFFISTSTAFINGSSLYYAISGATSTGTTTAGSSLADCGVSGGMLDFSYFACMIGNRVSDIFQWLFLPKTGSLTQYGYLKTELETKVPFGYFVLIRNAIQGINASTTSTFTLTLDQGVLGDIITPLRTALAWILLMGFGFWFYMRMKHLDI